MKFKPVKRAVRTAKSSAKSSWGKKAQDAANAATLVALIGGLIILYMLFLPPSERDKLLEFNNVSNDRIIPGQISNDTLLLEKPGRLTFIVEDEFTHEIPSFTLFKTTSAQEIKKENPFSVRNGWFDKQRRNVTFLINSLENTDNVMLTFNTQKRQGRLEMKLNGNVIFDGALESSNVVPISLDKKLLTDQNLLEFSVNPVGLAFWTTNEYTISGLKVTADVTDLSRQESKNIITLTDTEKFNLLTAKLKFNPNCVQEDVGTLNVWINNFEVLSGIPECRILNKVEVPINLLDSGENTLRFKTNKGSYLVDQVVLETKLKQEPTTVYFFEISHNQSKKINDRSRKANLSINFVRKDDDKKVIISVNGHVTSINTKDRIYSRILPKEWLKEGDNYVEIEPKTTLDIIELRIDLRK